MKRREIFGRVFIGVVLLVIALVIFGKLQLSTVSNVLSAGFTGLKVIVFCLAYYFAFGAIIEISKKSWKETVMAIGSSVLFATICAVYSLFDPISYRLMLILLVLCAFLYVTIVMAIGGLAAEKIDKPEKRKTRDDNRVHKYDPKIRRHKDWNNIVILIVLAVVLVIPVITLFAQLLS